MPQIDLLIFDLDGTLVDTRQDLANSVNYARSKFGCKALPLEQVMQYVGNGLHKLIQRSLPEDSHDEIDRAIGFFREYYGEHLLDYSTTYPGVQEVLRHFYDKKKAVISNKPVDFCRIILHGLGLKSNFDVILGGDSLTIMKPDPEPIFHVLKTLQVRPNKAVMIGDSSTDMQAGKQAHVYTCGVTYGYRKKEILDQFNPDFMIDELSALKEKFT
ncbi:MAG: HAD family hydrolase [bacterium]